MIIIKTFSYVILASVGAGTVWTTIGQSLGNPIVWNLIAVVFWAMVWWLFYNNELKD